MFDALLSRIKQTLFPGSEAIALPMMDGALKPNQLLDEARVLRKDLPDCDDAVALSDDAVLISAGRRLYRLLDANATQSDVAWEHEDELGALAVAGTAIYVALAGSSVVRIENGKITAKLDAVEGHALRSVTALCVLPGGRIAIAEGSTVNDLGEWTRDLLERRCAGRVVIAEADLSSASTLVAGLAWPAGLCVRDAELWISESWRHRVKAISLSGGPQRTVLDKLPGYPGRLAADPDGGVWLAIFAMRTQLIEFVLRERDYCKEMLASVNPRDWIAPSLSTTGHCLEPLQGGAIKKLGIVKPWAPPRSYGLVLRLSAQGELISSQHSRVGGIHHGITGVVRQNDRLIAVSRGSGRVLAVEALPS